MKNCGIVISVIMGFCLHFSQVYTASSSYKLDPRCLVNNGISVDMNNCSNFLICLHGRVRRVIPCSQGLLYDEQLKACNHKHNVKCGNRPITPEQDSDCYLKNIRVTLKVENIVKPPYFTLQTTVEAPRQSLENFMLLAAGRDDRFRFSSEPVDSFGMFVTELNGLKADSFSLTAWLPFDGFNREIDISIREYFPEDGDTIMFRFFSFGQQQPSSRQPSRQTFGRTSRQRQTRAQTQGCSGSGCRQVKSRLLVNG